MKFILSLDDEDAIRVLKSPLYFYNDRVDRFSPVHGVSVILNNKGGTTLDFDDSKNVYAVSRETKEGRLNMIKLLMAEFVK